MITDLKPCDRGDVELRTCENCGKHFDVPPFKIAAKFVRFCVECSEGLIEADRKKSLVDAETLRQSDWKVICPPIYLHTDPSKLPSPTKLQRVLNWKYGPRGLTLHGPTGTGKSRCAWKLMEREWKSGRRVAVINCEFTFQYQERYAISAAGVLPWLESFMKVPLLLLDDALKVKLTDSVEQALFCIVNYRAEHYRPIITTTNDTGESLEQRISQDRGAALIRRLREFSDAIGF